MGARVIEELPQAAQTVKVTERIVEQVFMHQGTRRRLPDRLAALLHAVPRPAGRTSEYLRW